MAPAGPQTHIFWIWGAVVGCFRVKTELKRTYFAPAGRLRRESIDFRDNWKAQTSNSWIFDEILRNSSCTRQVGLIIDSSRSGTCFSSC